MLASSLRQRGRIAFGMVLLALAIGLAQFNGLGKLDASVREVFAAASPAALAPEVVVVSIGPDSVKQVGRWPWPHDIHVEMIEKISAQGPLALGVDMLLALPTPDRPDGQRLAVAMGRSATALPPVLTAVLAGRELIGDASLDPLSEAAGLPGDRSAAGMVRHSLLAGGGAERWWRHLAVGTIGAGRAGGDVDIGAAPTLRRVGNMSPEPAAAVRTSLGSLPSPDPDHISVTAGDVLSGKVPPDVFRDRIVLVGIATSGMLDARVLMRASPMGVESGIEASAGMADALWQAGHEIDADAWLNSIFTAGLAMLLLTAMWTQPPARAFKVCAAILVLGIALAFVAWRLVGLWIAPGALLVVSLPVLAMLMHQLSLEEPPAVAKTVVMPARLHSGDPGQTRGARFGSLATRDTSSESSAQRPRESAPHTPGELQSLRDFLMAAIESLPDIILVCDASGQVVIGNQAAARYFGVAAPDMRRGSLLALLATLTPPPGFAWTTPEGRFEFARYQHGVECRDGNGAEFLLKCAPCATLPVNDGGWIVSLVDVGALRDAERRRDDAMRFLSHDMRSPLTAILALLTLHHEGDAELPEAEVLSRIRRLASRSLALAESFVQLARAEPLEHTREPLDLADIVMDAADDCWSQAQAKRITIDVDVPPNAAQSEGDRELVRRAVINLVNNAVKYSPRGSRVVCAVYRVEDEWCVAVRDEGRGIAFEDRELLFKKFVRLGEREPDAEPGIGLGLAFTKTVVDRHGGRIEVDSVLGVGSEFRFYLKVTA
jgi:signal transduction histidine kinase/CHASE2 domain-containing sensor protein